MTYTIYRLKETDSAESMRFMGSDFWKKKGLTPTPDLYEPIYNGDGLDKLDWIYTAFQGDRRPQNFKGYSMSVSDVVELDGVFWFCDNIGWLQLTDWRSEA